jgi:hypothetical protein
VAKLTTTNLEIERCPHCNVDSPLLNYAHQIETKNFDLGKRIWRIYICNRCGGLVSAWSIVPNAEVIEMFPSSTEVDEALPDRAREYLRQALNSLSAPAGAVMLAASAVDAMLKGKGLKEGSLYSRIDKAASNHLITNEMAAWAHDVRLDANDQRHADEDIAIPDMASAKHAVDFAVALGQFIYVLPAQVKRGIAETKKA